MNHQLQTPTWGVDPLATGQHTTSDPSYYASNDAPTFASNDAPYFSTNAPVVAHQGAASGQSAGVLHHPNSYGVAAYYGVAQYGPPGHPQPPVHHYSQPPHPHNYYYGWGMHNYYGWGMPQYGVPAYNLPPGQHGTMGHQPPAPGATSEGGRCAAGG